jgi:hypothetical protein
MTGSKRRRRTLNLKRSDYLDYDSYARDVLRSGGPDLDDIGHLGSGSGPHSEILSIVWGASWAEFEAMCAASTLCFELGHAQRTSYWARQRRFKPTSMSSGIYCESSTRAWISSSAGSCSAAG